MLEDVYEEFMKYEKVGQLKIFRFNDLSLDDKNQMTMDMANYFKKMNLYQDDDKKANFINTILKKLGNWQIIYNVLCPLKSVKNDDEIHVKSVMINSLISMKSVL